MKLKAQNITKSYKNRLILLGVSLSANTGEIVGIMGANGAGKTTLFSILAGMTRPDKGKITLDETDITNVKIHKRAKAGLEYLPQEPSIFRGLSVEDNIKAILQITMKDREQINEQLDKLLDSLELSHLRNSKAPFLSGGERRKVEIARALATFPFFLLLDEPFAGIDPISVVEISEILLKLKASGIGIIITDHNIRETMRILDRGYIMSEGKILTSGTPDEIFQDQHAKKLYFGEMFQM